MSLQWVSRLKKEKSLDFSPNNLKNYPLLIVPIETRVRLDLAQGPGVAEPWLKGRGRNPDRSGTVSDLGSGRGGSSRG